MSTISIDTVSLRNFLSYGNNTTSITLKKDSSTTLIKGQVIDESSINNGSNGSGKTTILNAIVYAFYDRALSSDISKDELVNDVNNKNMEVMCTFSVGDGFKYRIERRRKMKDFKISGNSALLYQISENGDEVDITPHSVQLVNDKLEQLLGIPYELFIRIIVFSASNIPFLDLSSTVQKNILEELFQQTILTKKADALKALIKDSESSIKTYQLKIDNAIAEQARHQKLIENTKQRIQSWEDNRKQEMVDIALCLKNLAAVDVEHQQSLHESAKFLQQTIRDYTKELSGVISDISSSEAKINKYKQEIQSLQSSICPYCEQEFKDTTQKIALCEQKITDLTTAITEAEAVRNSIENLLIDFQQQLEDTKQQITVDNIQELVKHKSQMDIMQNKLVDLSNAVNPHEASLDDLVNVKVPEVDYTSINKASNILEHQKFLLKLLTKKDSFVRKAILQKHLPLLNKRLQHYIKILGLPFAVEFTHEMVAKISKFGKQRSFGCLSTGQRARVNIALSFAFRDVLQAIHKKINMCVLDEVLDVGLCPVGVLAAAKLLKQVAKEENIAIYIISHRDEVQDMFDHTLSVQFEGGFSNIIQD